MTRLDQMPMTPLRRRFIDDMLLRNYSPRTIETYVTGVVRVAKYFRRSPELLGHEEIRLFQLELLRRKVSWCQFNQTVCALRFLYAVTLNRPGMVASIPFGKRPKTLPVVLSPEEVMRFLDAAKPGRERTLLDVAYSCGPRLQELLGLQVADIDSPRMVLHIRRGKGQKDRMVPLSPRLLEVLRAYWQVERPQASLFPGTASDIPVTDGTVQRLCHRTARRAGLSKRITPHTLRHSYATHLLEAGVDLLSVQALLGHSHFNTTAKYLHVSMRRLHQLPHLLKGLRVTPVHPADAARVAEGPL